MTTEYAQLALQILGMVFTAGAIWGALRAELRALRTDVDHASRSARRAHERIDNHLEQHA